MPDALAFHAVAPLAAYTLDVQLEVGAETVVLVGPNGAGKTTLLRVLLGLHAPAQLQLTLAGQCVVDTARKVSATAETRGFGYVPQHYALFPHLSVRDNIGFAVRERPVAAVVEPLLAALQLEALATRLPGALSGGEQQRVALARALAARPLALLLDEPLAALDVLTRAAVRAMLGPLLAAWALPTLLVTHDPDDARLLGQRVVVIEAGGLTQVGTWAELVAAPASPFVAQLVAHR